MSENRRALLALLEQDPELRPVAPLLRVILEARSDTLGDFVTLADLWSNLKSEGRALLVLMLKDDLTVKEIARLVGVHHRTLYKSRLFKRTRSRLRSSKAGSLPHGRKANAEDEADFDAWE